MYLTEQERQSIADYIIFIQRDKITFTYNITGLKRAYGKIMAEDILGRVEQGLKIKIKHEVYA